MNYRLGSVCICLNQVKPVVKSPLPDEYLNDNVNLEVNLGNRAPCEIEDM